MIVEQHVPGSIGDGNRFSDKIMRNGKCRMCAAPTGWNFQAPEAEKADFETAETVT